MELGRNVESLSSEHTEKRPVGAGARAGARAALPMLFAAVLCALAPCASLADPPQTGAPRAEAPQGMTDAEIIDAVVDDFMYLAEVPRPSHHEEKISAFLMDWAREHGFEPVQDYEYNVMFDVPATEGYEDLPLTILQAHMDMVVAVADDKDFDPLSDPVTVIRDDDAGTLTADGTSLGADDGSGLALILAAAEGKMAHGPIRAIVTVDEEDGMEGALNLDESWLDGASRLINIDNEDADDVLVSTAAGDSVHFNRQLTFVDATGDLALVVGISNLTGGHSGAEIHKGRLNGIIGLAGFLKQLDEDGVDYELAAFKGGTAGNAIPTKASATIVVSAQDRDAVEQEMAAYRDMLSERYEGIEDDIRCTVTVEDDLPQVVSAQDKSSAIRFATEVIDGVYTWSADMEGLVESSSNLGFFNVNEGGLTGSTYARSSVAQKEDEILEAQMALARACGFEASSVKMADAWPYDPDSELLALTQRVYREQNGRDITVSALHAGLECGTFKALRPDLDMVSIGPDLADVHSTKETLYLDSIPKVWRLLEGLLTQA